MGMSASQARLLSLKARQSNLEYQGQQINQARAILSQQCTALYNSLLSMTVPTPPSTTDYTKVQYKGQQGATKFTIGTVTPESGGTYNVEMKYERNGNSIKGGSYMEVNTYVEPEFLTGQAVNQKTEVIQYIKRGDEVQNSEITNGTYNNSTKVMHSVTSAQSGVNDYYYMDKSGKGFVKANSFNDAKSKGQGGVVYTATTIGDIKSKNPDYNFDVGGEDFVYNPNESGEYTSGGMTAAEFNNNEFYKADGTRITLDMCDEVTGSDGKKYYILPEGAIRKSSSGNTQIKNPNYDPNEATKGTTVGGNTVQNFDAQTLGTYYEEAIKAIQNSCPEYKEGQNPGPSAITDDFKVVFKTNGAGERIPYFVKTADYNQKANMSGANGQNQVEVFSLEPNGAYTENVQTEGCKLTFDGSGRITSIGIPIYDPETGELKGHDEISLEAETVTDEAAYKDAMAQYEYETYLYDQKNKEINAKTEIIQQEDKNLELKLQKLDNERTQITTEIEAVEKVINDNIEGSYKTFSG